MNVQELFNIKPRLTPQSTEKDLVDHVKNCHAILELLATFMIQNNLQDKVTKFLEDLKK